MTPIYDSEPQVTAMVGPGPDPKRRPRERHRLVGAITSHIWPSRVTMGGILAR